ncbi:hypothetical protein GE09DRAFT_1164738 [Coniochaeta sp. 2T2.1]|nr:hypothetical protein GE09DRAFT_1164738 [Coniochaeta sp. 2T2.1]
MATNRQDYSPVSTPTTNNQGLSTTPQHVMRETQQQRTARLGLSQPAPYNDNHNNNTTSNYASNSRRNYAVNRHTNNVSRSSCHSRNSSTSSIGSINHFGIDENNNFLMSPHGTPQSQRFANVIPVNNRQMEDMSMSFGPYLSQMDAMMQKGQQGYDNNNPGQDFQLYAPDSALSTPTFMTFAEASPSQSPHGWMSEGEARGSRRSSRRISGGILDRVAKFENMGPEPIQAGRPYTPPGQNDNMYYPPTPMDTPHDRMVKHQARPNRFSDDYDESLEETIKPGRGHRSNRRNNGVFEQMRQEAEAMAQQQQSGHQRTNTMSSTYTDDSGMSTADFIDMASMDQFVKIEGDYDDLPSNNNLNISQNSPPMHPHMANFTMSGAFDQRPTLQSHELDSQETVRPGKSSAQSSRGGSPHRRTESLASIVSAASISSINIEETKTDTGVTIDEIQTYIDGPDAEAKWTCTFESCGKKFGRKENIKSHVQTHLNDRQYQCPTCKKCFVRQHDLKRHAKIHTGIKPYPCECGNSFARHDALTRHRQRGMCIGAFDGIVRKVVKRGRPRKYRPEMEDRLVKSEQTRRKNKASANGSQSGRHTSSPSSASSQSGYSDSSAGNSPSNDNDFDGVLDDAPFPDMDMMDIGNGTVRASALTSATLSALHQQNLNSTSSRTTSTKTLSPGTISSAFMPTSSSFEDSNNNKYNVTSVSPEQITAASPSTMSNYSFHGLPTLPADNNRASPEASAHSPAKSTASNYTHQPGTPPDLSASSSPPHASSDAAQPPRYFDFDDADDFDPNASGLSTHSIGLGTTAAAHAEAVSCGAGNMSGISLVDVNDETFMLNAFGNNQEDRLAQFHQAERDMMMGGGKYFEDVDEVALFTNADDVDVFFGSS